MVDVAKWFTQDGTAKVRCDPYRDSESPFRRAFFDDDGDLKDGVLEELEIFAHKHKIHAFSMLAEMIHAERFARNTKGNYSTIYYWR